jgi:hypothetical protein
MHACRLWSAEDVFASESLASLIEDISLTISKELSRCFAFYTHVCTLLNAFSWQAKNACVPCLFAVTVA